MADTTYSFLIPILAFQEIPHFPNMKTHEDFFFHFSCRIIIPTFKIFIRGKIKIISWGILCLREFVYTLVTFQKYEVYAGRNDLLNKMLQKVLF